MELGINQIHSPFRNKRKNEGVEFDERPTKQPQEDFGEKVIQNLTMHLNFKCDLKKNWLWSDGKPTHQNVLLLAKKINQLHLKNEMSTKLAIKLKRQDEAIQFAIINITTGSVEAMATKIKKLGSSLSAKIQCWEIKEESNPIPKIRAIKLIDTKGISGNRHEFYVKILENEVTILNTLHRVLKRKRVEGAIKFQNAIQAPYEEKFIVLSETKEGSEDSDYQVGRSNKAYDGDAFFEKENDWRKKWTSQEILWAFCNLFNALKKMHASGFLHGDIKLENLFRDESTKTLLIADFGGGMEESKLRKTGDSQDHPQVPLKKHIHTDIWTLFQDIVRLEEIQDSQEEPNSRIEKFISLRKKMDVFCLGEALFVCLTGSRPCEKYKEWNNNLVYIETIKSPLKIEKALQKSPFAKEYTGLGPLIRRLLDFSPEERPTAEQAFEEFKKILTK